MDIFIKYLITITAFATLRDPAVVRQMDLGAKAWVFAHALLVLLMVFVFFTVYSLVFSTGVAIGMTAVMIMADIALARVMERRQMLLRRNEAPSGSVLHCWRLASCLVIAGSIGYSSVIQQNADEIDRRSAQRLANQLAPLLAQVNAEKQAATALYVVPQQRLYDASLASLPGLQDAVKAAKQAHADSETRELAARTEAIRQAGGVDGRIAGEKAKWRAATAEADLALGEQVGLLTAVGEASDSLKRTQTEQQRLIASIKTASDKVSELVKSKEAEIRLDPRWRDQISGGLIQRSLSLLDMMRDGIPQFVMLLIQILIPIVVAIFVETFLLSFSLLMAASGSYYAEAQEMHTHAHQELFATRIAAWREAIELHGAALQKAAVATPTNTAQGPTADSVAETNAAMPVGEVREANSGAAAQATFSVTPLSEARSRRDAAAARQDV